MDRRHGIALPVHPDVTDAINPGQRRHAAAVSLLAERTGGAQRIPQSFERFSIVHVPVREILPG
jgi:hypothetical protein